MPYKNSPHVKHLHNRYMKAKNINRYQENVGISVIPCPRTCHNNNDSLKKKKTHTRTRTHH